MFLRSIFMLLAFSVIGMTACKSKPPASAKKTAPAPTAKKSAGYSLATMEMDILTEVNRHRSTKGLPPLQANSVIETEASMHSQQMASRQVSFGHSGYDARINRIKKRISGVISSGENVAMGKMNARAVVQSWLNSTPHKKNIEGQFNLTGIGVSRDNKGVIYYTQIFSLKSP